jgi:glycosyltransferase involved in cell wall biosynthesis
MLSIIIITKEEEELLPSLLESIKKQDLTDHEIIVSDADSKDRTREIAKGFGCKIVEGGTPSVGRNNGAKASKGDVILFLDADVVLPAHFIKKNTDEFRKRNLGCGIPRYTPLSSNIIDKLAYGFFNLWAGITQYFYPHAIGCCIFCRRDVFDKINGFDERTFYAEDHDFANKSRKFGRFGVLKSEAVECNMRRFKNNGHWKMAMEYLFEGTKRVFLGKRYRPSVDYELHGKVNVMEEYSKQKKIDQD